jgi:hypothetical protein
MDLFLAFPVLVLADRHGRRVRRRLPRRPHPAGPDGRDLRDQSSRRGPTWRGSSGARCSRCASSEFVEAARSLGASRPADHLPRDPARTSSRRSSSTRRS